MGEPSKLKMKDSNSFLGLLFSSVILVDSSLKIVWRIYFSSMNLIILSLNSLLVFICLFFFEGVGC